MRRVGCIGRRSGVAAAAAGTAGYWLAFRPDWRDPALLLYDVPTLALCFGYAGRALGRLAVHRSRRTAAPVGVLASSAALAAGSLAGLPLSGHLTMATTVGILEQLEAADPPLARAASAAPAVVVMLVRAFWPQTPLMHVPLNTAMGLAAGGLLGSAGAVLARRGAD